MSSMMQATPGICVGAWQVGSGQYCVRPDQTGIFLGMSDVSWSQRRAAREGLLVELAGLSHAVRACDSGARCVRRVISGEGVRCKDAVGVGELMTSNGDRRC
jgi:hypothetical protein